MSAVKSKLKEILNETQESENEAIEPVPNSMQSDVSENVVKTVEDEKLDVEETAEDKISNDPVKQVSGDPIPENEAIEPVPKPMEQSDVSENVVKTVEDDPVKQVTEDPMELGKAINGPETPSIDDESENLWSSMTTLLTTASNPDVPIGNALCTLLTSDRPNF